MKATSRRLAGAFGSWASSGGGPPTARTSRDRRARRALRGGMTPGPRRPGGDTAGDEAFRISGTTMIKFSCVTEDYVVYSHGENWGGQCPCWGKLRRDDERDVFD